MTYGMFEAYYPIVKVVAYRLQLHQESSRMGKLGRQSGREDSGDDQEIVEKTNFRRSSKSKLAHIQIGEWDHMM